MKAFLYHHANTPLHKLSSVTKIISLTTIFTLAMVFANPWYLMALTILALIFATWGNALKAVWNLRFLLLMLFIFPTLMWSFYAPGFDEIYRIGAISVTWEGLFYGISMALRLDGMLIAGVVLLSTTKVEDFTAGLHFLGIPYRMSFALTLAFRLVPLYFNNYEIILQAQQSRGLNISQGNIFSRLKKSIPLLIPVFVSAIRKTDQLAVALESKGFGYEGQRTCLFPIVLTRVDKWIMGVELSLIILMLSLRFWLWNFYWK